MAGMLQDLRIEPGAAVEASDGRLGTVDEVVIRPEDGGLAYLVVRRGWSNEQLLVPAELIRAVDGPREVRLGVTRDEARERAAAVPSDALLLARDRGVEVVIPIVEERLIPEKRKVDLGELRVHKLVDEVEEAVRQPVTRDDLVVERVPVNQPLDEPAGTRYEGDWLVIPIMREVLVVTKQLMLVEEVRISKREVTEEQEVRETTRHERLEIEDATLHGVAGLDAGPATAATQTFTNATNAPAPAMAGGVAPHAPMPAAASMGAATTDTTDESLIT
jgi:uncharacterized protein (TIGR02271 family)